jgi:hypothetical protein
VFANSSSSLHTACLPLAQLYFNTLIHVQFANQPCFVPVNTSLLHDLINLVHFTWANAICHSMKQAHNLSCISKVHSDIILSIPIASLVPFLHHNQKLSSPSTSLIFLSILLLCDLTTIFACVC